MSNLYVVVSRASNSNGELIFSGNSEFFAFPRDAKKSIDQKIKTFLQKNRNFKDLQVIPRPNKALIVVPEWNSVIAEYCICKVDLSDLEREKGKRGFVPGVCTGIYAVERYNSANTDVFIELFGTLDKAKEFIDTRTGNAGEGYWMEGAWIVKYEEENNRIKFTFRVDNLPEFGVGKKGKPFTRRGKNVPAWVDILPDLPDWLREALTHRAQKAIPVSFGPTITIPLTGQDIPGAGTTDSSKWLFGDNLDIKGGSGEIGQPISDEKCICPRGGKGIAVGTNYVMPLGEELLFRHIPTGRTILGDNQSENKEHPFEVEKDFWMAIFPVTVGNWMCLMEENLQWPWVELKGRYCRSTMRDFDEKNFVSYPAIGIDREKSEEFCAQLNQRYGNRLPEGYCFRLPTEDEWEYACRCNAAPRTKYSWGNNVDLTRLNCEDSSIGHLTPVNKYPPNSWGIYDMHGNAMEQCYACRSYYNRDALPICGGSFMDPADSCTSASRADRWGKMGFRVVIAPKL